MTASTISHNQKVKAKNGDSKQYSVNVLLLVLGMCRSILLSLCRLFIMCVFLVFVRTRTLLCSFKQKESTAIIDDTLSVLLG